MDIKINGKQLTVQNVHKFKSKFTVMKLKHLI